MLLLPLFFSDEDFLEKKEKKRENKGDFLDI